MRCLTDVEDLTLSSMNLIKNQMGNSINDEHLSELFIGWMTEHKSEFYSIRGENRPHPFDFVMKFK